MCVCAGGGRGGGGSKNLKTGPEKTYCRYFGHVALKRAGGLRAAIFVLKSKTGVILSCYY